MSGIEALTPTDRRMLIDAIAHRQGTAKELSSLYDVTVSELRQFVEDHRPLIEAAANDYGSDAGAQGDGEPTPTQLSELWISNKFERLVRYQQACDLLFADIKRSRLSGSDLSTALREFRSYSLAAANELGQLLHRGAGENSEGDSLSIDIGGVDLNALK